MFPADRSLAEAARVALRDGTGLRFVVGAAGTGKTTVCAAIGERYRIDVLDMDARIYGAWHGRFDPVRHPASHAWAAAADPLAWQLALAPDAYLGFQAASTVEALDLLAAELCHGDPGRTVLVDGGFGSVAALASIVPADRIACLALPDAEQARVWTATEERRAFLDMVAGVAAVTDPAGRFLELDDHLARAMAREAIAAGVPVLDRRPGDGIGPFAERVARALGLG
jgi:hypothetical protein